MKHRSLLDPTSTEELEGYTAFFKGIPREDNPYKKPADAKGFSSKYSALFQ